MKRVWNFSAGPCALPVEVLERAQKEMLDYGGSGMSVMEMSHRSPVYQEIFDTTEERLRRVLDIPEDYTVLFLQGGASSQFAMIPLNFKQSGRAAYIDTGAWSKKAIAEAKRFLSVEVLASSEDRNFSYIPEIPRLSDSYDYLHLTSNNTIYGTRFSGLPEVGTVPVVADMSSMIASEAIDFSSYGLVYAGAQKNLGPAGVTLVIVRRDLVGGISPQTPTMFAYKTHVEKGSMFNTPPCYAIYIVGLVMEWLEKLGGVSAIEKINGEKADLLYNCIDSEDFYASPVAKRDRSRMNIPFTLADSRLDGDFLSQAGDAGLVNLKGHRSVGGMRASIYNAMPREGVAALVDFMKDFSKRRG